MENELLIRLSEEGAEAEDLEQLTGFLRTELLALDVDDVRTVPAGRTPPGARAVDVALVGTLLVSLGGGLTGLSQVVTVVREWLGRTRTARPSLSLTLNGDTLEITAPTDAQMAEALRIFVEKHSALGTRP